MEPAPKLRLFLLFGKTPIREGAKPLQVSESPAELYWGEWVVAVYYSHSFTGVTIATS